MLLLIAMKIGTAVCPFGVLMVIVPSHVCELTLPGLTVKATTPGVDAVAVPLGVTGTFNQFPQVDGGAPRAGPFGAPCTVYS